MKAKKRGYFFVAKICSGKKKKKTSKGSQIYFLSKLKSPNVGTYCKYQHKHFFAYDMNCKMSIGTACKNKKFQKTKLFKSRIFGKF